MPHDVDESQLDAMAARVAAVVTEEQAARNRHPGLRGQVRWLR